MVKQCITESSQHKNKKRYEGGRGEKSLEKGLGNC